MKRIDVIDFARGLVMIIMALDHTRDFMHIHSLAQNPTNLATTTPILFFTRWITHLCAPTFVFLSGVSAFIVFKKDGNYSKSSSFLLTRGLWLIILEFTLVNLALTFDIQFRTFMLEVIGAIGFGFIILALLLKLRAKWIGMIGLVIIAGYELLQYLPVSNPLLKTVISSLFTLNVFPVTPHHNFLTGYPPIPWLGIMLTGFGAGHFFESDLHKRRRTFLATGLVALVLFITIRFLNIYGEPVKWSVQKNGLFTFLSFMNVSKYPPSLLFCLVTLGVTCLILFFADGVKNKFTQLVSVYGQVPLFYFLVHLYILHTLMLVIMFLQGFSWSELIFENFNLGRPKAESGVSLGVIYIIWLSVVIALYPLCKWYGNYKATHKKKKWLRYL